jgi:hypothetical protein
MLGFFNPTQNYEMVAKQRSATKKSIVAGISLIKKGEKSPLQK